MYYTVYKTTNILNNKIYIGKHQTHNVNDRYFGSGKALKQAIKKHGKKSFIKEILFVFDNEQDMNLKEKELVTDEFIASNKNYNCGVGGEGGSHFKGKTHTPENRAKLSLKSSGHKMSDSQKQFVSKLHKNKILSDETKKKIGDNKKQLITINNGSIIKMLHKDLPIPDGWVRGRKF